MLFIIAPCSSLCTWCCRLLNEYLRTVYNNSNSRKFPEWFREIFDIYCLEGQIRRTSLNILAKKQIQALKVLLTEPGDIPSISERTFVNRPNLSRTRVKINSWNGLKVLFLPGLFFVGSFCYLTSVDLLLSQYFILPQNGLIKLKFYRVIMHSWARLP